MSLSEGAYDLVILEIILSDEQSTVNARQHPKRKVSSNFRISAGQCKAEAHN
jgi:hypothetical protein